MLGVAFFVESSLHLLAAVGWFNPLPVIIFEHAFPLTGFAVALARPYVTFGGSGGIMTTARTELPRLKASVELLIYSML